MTDYEKRVADLEVEVRDLGPKIARRRFDLEYPPGHPEREERMPTILRPKPPTKRSEPTQTVGGSLKLDEASR